MTMRFLRMGVVLIGTFCLAAQCGAASPNLKQQLASQQFSGTLDGNVKFTSLGAVHCGAENLHVIFYEWNESPPPGEAVHASYRIIVMDGERYLGSYVVQDKPKLQDGVLRFPYSADGDSIGCGREGVLPGKVLLDGEIVPLAK